MSYSNLLDRYDFHWSKKCERKIDKRTGVRKNQSYYLFDGYYSPDLSTLISKQFEEHSVLESSYYKFPHPLHRSKPDHSRTFLRERKDSKSVMCTVKFIERYVCTIEYSRLLKLSFMFCWFWVFRRFVVYFCKYFMLS